MPFAHACNPSANGFIIGGKPVGSDKLLLGFIVFSQVIITFPHGDEFSYLVDFLEMLSGEPTEVIDAMGTVVAEGEPTFLFFEGGKDGALSAGVGEPAAGTHGVNRESVRALERRVDLHGRLWVGHAR